MPGQRRPLAPEHPLERCPLTVPQQTRHATFFAHKQPWPVIAGKHNQGIFSTPACAKASRTAPTLASISSTTSP